MTAVATGQRWVVPDRVADDHHVEVTPLSGHDGRIFGLMFCPQTPLAPRRESPQRPTVQLTAREADILGLLGAGMSNAEIGGALGLSECAVKTTCARRLFRKLGAHDRAHAVAIGFRAGYLR